MNGKTNHCVYNINYNIQYLKKKWGSGLWSRGYYDGTAGNVNAETIRKYIEAQKSKEVKS